MNRREILIKGMSACASLAALSPWIDLAPVAEAWHSTSADDVALPDKQQWLRLDGEIRRWWDDGLVNATEELIRGDASKSALFLPFPYPRVSAGAGGTYEWQCPVDTAFWTYALFAHERLDMVRNLLLNHLFLIERYGYPPNANNLGVVTRSQTPFFVPPSIWRYYVVTKDTDLLYQAYPLLKKEYRDYWNASHHQTPIGLATNRDLGDPVLSPELASEAEVLDWTPVFGGDVRRCVPIATNAGLVSHARILSKIAMTLGRRDEARTFAREADHRVALINRYCWNEEAGLFLEYDFVAGKQLPYISEFAFWTLLTGVANELQAARLARNLYLLEKLHGVACTDKEYADPHSDATYEIRGAGKYKRLQDAPPPTDAPTEYLGGSNQLMWMYPAGWATTNIIITAGLDAYGYTEASRRISAKFLKLMLNQYQKTGLLWEKYNVVDGSLILPNARYGNLPYRSFTAAAVVLLGRRLFQNQPLEVM